MKRAITLLLMVILSACGFAHSDDTHVEMLTAPDGSQCYAIVQAGQIRGGSCK